MVRDSPVVDGDTIQERATLKAGEQSLAGIDSRDLQSKIQTDSTAFSRATETAHI